MRHERSGIAVTSKYQANAELRYRVCSRNWIAWKTLKFKNAAVTEAAFVSVS